MFLWRTDKNYPSIIIKYPPYLFHCLKPPLTSSHLSLSILTVIRAAQMTLKQYLFTLSLSFAALREAPNHIPVHSLMLSSHLFFCLLLFLAPFTFPWKTVFAMPEDLEMWPHHLSVHFFNMVRRSSCTPIAFRILLRTSSFVTWSLKEIFRSLIASHLKGLDPSFKFCCQGPALTGIQEAR